MAVRGIDDRKLVEQYKAGDEDAFTQIVSLYYPQLMNHARRRLHDPRAAEDAVQEAMLRAYRALGRFNGDYRLAAWLHRIVENVCADEGNRRRREGELTDKITALPLAPETDVADEAIADPEMTQALKNLAPSYREALVLRYVEGLPYRDVAARTGVSEENARARAHRGRAVLRRVLGASHKGRGAAALIPAFAAWALQALRRQRPAVELHPVAAVEMAANRAVARIAPAADHMVSSGMGPGSGVFTRAAAVVAAVTLPVASAGIGTAMGWFDSDKPAPQAAATASDQPRRSLTGLVTTSIPAVVTPAAAPAPAPPRSSDPRARARVAGVDGDTERWDWFGRNPNRDADGDGYPDDEESAPEGEYVRADALGASAEAGTTRITGGGEYQAPEKLAKGRIEAILRTADDRSTGGKEAGTLLLTFTEEGGRSQPVRIQFEGRVVSFADEGELTRYAISGTWRMAASGLGIERNGRFEASMVVGSADAEDLRITLDPDPRP